MKRSDRDPGHTAQVGDRLRTAPDLVTLEAEPETVSLEPLYWLTAAWCGILMVLPYEPVKLVLYGVFWIALAWVLNNLPRYVPLLVILGMPAMVFAPKSIRSGIPLINHHVYFMAALILAIYLIGKRAKKEPSPNPVKWPPIYLAVLLSCSLVVSHLTGSALGHSWDRGWFQASLFHMSSSAKNFAMFPFFAPIAFRLLSTREHMRRTVHFVAIATLMVSLQGIWSLRHVILGGAVGPVTRAGGFVKEPNDFGGFLALMICILFPLFLDGKLSRLERILFATTMGGAAIALLSTLSRGSWLALIVAMAYLSFARGLKVMVVMLAIVMTATIWLPQSVIDRVQGSFRSNDAFHKPFTEDKIELDGSAGGRIEHWAALIDQWAASPIFGHGYGSYSRLNSSVPAVIGGDRIPEGRGFRTGGRFRRSPAVAAHSTIIELTAEEGTLGLIAYIGLIWTLSMGGRGLVRLRKRKPLSEDDDEFLYPLALGMIAATICLVVLDTSGARMKNSLIMTNMWMLAGGLARQYWNRRQAVRATEIEEARQESRRRKSKSRLTPGQPVRRPV